MQPGDGARGHGARVRAPAWHYRGGSLAAGGVDAAHLYHGCTARPWSCAATAQCPLAESAGDRHAALGLPAASGDRYGARDLYPVAVAERAAPAVLECGASEYAGATHAGGDQPAAQLCISGAAAYPTAAAKALCLPQDGRGKEVREVGGSHVTGGGGGASTGSRSPWHGDEQCGVAAQMHMYAQTAGCPWTPVDPGGAKPPAQNRGSG
eukprot:3911598-Lingulodinium_polyedra.AAC.1